MNEVCCKRCGAADQMKNGIALNRYRGRLTVIRIACGKSLATSGALL